MGVIDYGSFRIYDNTSYIFIQYNNKMYKSKIYHYMFKNYLFNLTTYYFRTCF